MIDHPVQFAVVREDPEIETRLLTQAPQKERVLLVGSGGCTALLLRARFPQTEISLLEPNPAQLDLIDRKVSALTLPDEEKKLIFGIGSEIPSSLTAAGNFEALFRGFRNFLYEFVLEREDWLTFFRSETLAPSLLARVLASKYWNVAHQLFFADPLLQAMFGREAVQHAPPGSYPNHFQKVFERGLNRKDAGKNYFLHHVFLGHYLPESLPDWLVETSSPAAKPFRRLPCLAQDVASYSGYGLVSLSNLFDWMDTSQVAALAARLSRELDPGACIVFRQLNHAKDFRSLFDPSIRFDDALSETLFARDRSLFYTRLNIGFKH